MMNSKAVPINDTNFTQNELRLLKIAYFEDISEIYNSKIISDILISEGFM